MAIFDFDYKDALYRKNNNGQPCVWIAKPTTTNKYCVYHGIVGKVIHKTEITTHRKSIDEVKSKFTSKRKTR